MTVTMTLTVTVTMTVTVSGVLLSVHGPWLAGRCPERGWIGVWFSDLFIFALIDMTVTVTVTATIIVTVAEAGNTLQAL